MHTIAEKPPLLHLQTNASPYWCDETEWNLCPAQEREMDLIILVPWEAATKVSVAKRCVRSSSFSAARPGSREEERSDRVAKHRSRFFTHTL